MRPVSTQQSRDGSILDNRFLTVNPKRDLEEELLLIGDGVQMPERREHSLVMTASARGGAEEQVTADQGPVPEPHVVQEREVLVLHMGAIANAST